MKQPEKPSTQQNVDEHSSRSTARRFVAHPLVQQLLDMGLPEGPALELACGASGNALALGNEGREVVAVDISPADIQLLERETGERGLTNQIRLITADLLQWKPAEKSFALIICTFFWDKNVFASACDAVMDGGIIAWEAFTPGERQHQPSLPLEYCLAPGEPASLLPSNFELIEQTERNDGCQTRRFIARRTKSD